MSRERAALAVEEPTTLQVIAWQAKAIASLDLVGEYHGVEFVSAYAAGERDWPA